MMKAWIYNRIYLKGEYPEDLETMKRLQAITTRKNPAWVKVKKMGLKPFKRDSKNNWIKIPKYIKGYNVPGHDNSSMSFPVGLVDQVRKLVPDLTDKRRIHTETEFDFYGVERDYQEEAVLKIEESESGGIIEAPTGCGKTVMGVLTIFKLQRPTLILVHSKELLKQWLKAIKTHLGINPGDVSQFGGGKKTWCKHGKITVAIVNTFQQMLPEMTQEEKESWGLIIVDECHRTPSKMFSEVLDALPAEYKVGFSATAYRRDKLGFMLNWYIGPRLHTIPVKEMQDAGFIMVPKVKVAKSDFHFDFKTVCSVCGDVLEKGESVDDHDPKCKEAGGTADTKIEYSKMKKALLTDYNRLCLVNDLVSDIMAKRDPGEVVLVLSDTIDYLKRMMNDMPEKESSQWTQALLTGNPKVTSKKERDAIVEGLKAGKIDLVYSTTSLIGEGFDLPELSTVVLTTPIKFSGRLKQVLGRVVRTAPGKKTPVVVDILDNFWLLERTFDARKKVYREMNYQVEEV